MRDIEAICVSRDINSLAQHEYASKNYVVSSNQRVKDFECQCKIDICTCNRVKRKERYFNTCRQVYRSQRYSGWGFTDVGVGSVKTVCKKRVKRIYLPETEETGVGSSDFSFARRTRRNPEGGYYYRKKTSSKCVGGAIDNILVPVLSKKLSPIIKKISASTSPQFIQSDTTSNTEKDKSSKENLHFDEKPQSNKSPDLKNLTMKILLDKTKKPKNNVNKSVTVNIGDGKTFSSDSLIQHVYNLENPSKEKVKTSIDLIENKLEREYRKIFTTDRKGSNSDTKVKTISDLKSASLLRKRFEALRRGINKREKQEATMKISSKLSIPSKKDVSIASDPPSLESRSYSNTKIYSPKPSISNVCNAPIANPSYGKCYTNEMETISNSPVEVVDSDCQDVNDMFRLWGKKFNLEEDSNKAKKQKKKVEITLPTEKSNKKEKGRRFLFFGKKNKSKSKQPFRSKQGITAGRCELGDGLMIKIGTVNKCMPEIPIEKNEEISQDSIKKEKDWLKKFLSKKIDSRDSVRIRWNNNMYTTSSSTVLELMDCVYKNTGVLFSSKSEVSTGESSIYYTSHPRVNFMQQNIQAWMIPKTITDKPVINTPVNIVCPKKRNPKNIEITLSKQKWLIEKSKAFSQNIEFVLHSKNLVKHVQPESSEYIVIDIPKGYFSETSSDDKNNHTSDEQVYNIVEYETINSNSYLSKKKEENKIDSGDHAKHIQVTINVRGDEENELKILESNIENHDVNTNLEASNCYIPKPCDVISVRIITQRDIRDVKKPILKINDHIEDKSVHVLPPPKKCEVAESFLQDYYRNLTPLGIDLLSWCVSSDKLHISSGSNSLKSFKNQGDGSKSCSNIYDGYQASTIVSSCETSSCSHCKVVEEEKKADDSRTSKFFSKLIKRTFEPTMLGPDRKRVSPKDSLEVFKRRKIYASSNKSKWGVNDDRSEPFFMPEKNMQKNSNDCPKVEQNNSYINQTPKAKCKKRVLLQDCEIMDEIFKEQLSDKIVEGILSFKGTGGCDTCKLKTSQHTKQAQVIPQPTCEISQAPCKESCVKERKPPCSKKNSPTCHVPTPPSCPVGPPSPCQKPCPPSPPPCQISSPFAKPAHPKSPTRTPLSNSSTQCAERKPIPPRIHSPELSSPKRSRPCICPKKQSLSNIPKGPVSKKSSCISTPPHLPTSTSSDSSSKCRSKNTCKSSCTCSCEKCKKSSSHDFPWPLKNQQSNTPSKESGLSLKMSPCGIQKSSSKCITAIKRLIQKVSSSSFKQKECKPDCANRRKIVTRPSPPAPPPTMVSAPTPTTPNKSLAPKMLGLHLKKLPMPKNCSKECLSCDESQGVIRLNSREKITIKVKQSTPSTEEIREGCNIKVQDEDGQTLYERRDYRKVDRNRMHFVKDMYRDSQVQRISTPDTDMVLDKKALEINECKSDASISNIIEINLNLKFRQGDKTTELNMNKSLDTLTKEPENTKVQHKSSKEIYVVQDKTNLRNEHTDTRDVNIKIMINNYKTPVKMATNKQSVCLPATDEFSKKISEKFHTVSTGYSDIIERQTYSIHRTTIDLTNSSDNNKYLNKSKIKLAKKDVILVDRNSNDEIPSIQEPSVIEQVTRSYIINDKEKESLEVLTNVTICQTDVNTSLEKIEVTNDEKSATSISITNTDENINSDSTNIEDKGILMHRKIKKDEKKKILKQIFETASEIKKRNNKGEIQEIRHLLRAVLTSDSSDQENFEINNKLAEELTYESLKPDFFKDSNSMTNYYLDKSSISTKVSSKNDSEEVIYPTENVSESSSNTDVQKNLGCLCSHLGTKLNMKNNLNACCCRGFKKIDEEINCNIKADVIFDNIEVETQYSEHINEKNGSFIASSTKDELEKTLQSEQTLVTQKYTTDEIDVTNSSLEYIKNTNNLKKKIENIKSADVLQLNETKKAVLEIYTEKIITNEGNHMIARLPKFICEKESKIYNYQETFVGYKKLDKK